jgi:hypothetical protein
MIAATRGWEKYARQATLGGVHRAHSGLIAACIVSVGRPQHPHCAARSQLITPAWSAACVALRACVCARSRPPVRATRDPGKGTTTLIS